MRNMGRLSNIDEVKEIIDGYFINYALYECRSYSYQEFVFGRLTGMLYTAYLCGAITMEEYIFIDTARKAISVNRHKF